MTKQRRIKRKIINEINRFTGLPTRWPNGIIPYEYDAEFCKLYILLFNSIKKS
jgi:hypothetical protein